VIKKWDHALLLFCARTSGRESRNFELSHLKKEKKKNNFGHLVTFWFSTFAMLSRTARSLVGHENTQR